MTKEQIIRAWKDETYRTSLSAQQLGELPHNPAGMVELGADELGSAAGGEESTCVCISLGCCRTGLPSWFFSCVGCPAPDPGTFDYSCK